MSYNFSQRIENMPESVFSTMSRLAVRHNAFNLGQGFPESSGPDWLIEEFYKAMKDGKNQYAPSNGTLRLRKAVCCSFQKYYNIDFNPDTEITITAGATEGLYSTLTAILNPGDEVIIFEPYYDGYLYDILLNGGIPKFATLRKPDFSIDFDELNSLISNKTKLMIINNPHNPCGKVFNRNELEHLAAFASENDLLVLSDEVYQFLTYDNIEHIPFASIQGMKERTITVSSAGKTFSMTGWKIGWVMAKPEITQAVQKVHQWTTFAVNTPGQHAVAYGLDHLENYLHDFRLEYQSKRDLCFEHLKHSKFKAFDCKGSYFIMLEIPSERNTDDVKCAIELVENFSVATIPTSVFYSKSDEGKSMLRLCFAKDNITLINGINMLNQY